MKSFTKAKMHNSYSNYSENLFNNIIRHEDIELDENEFATIDRIQPSALKNPKKLSIGHIKLREDIFSQLIMLEDLKLDDYTILLDKNQFKSLKNIINNIFLLT